MSSSNHWRIPRETTEWIGPVTVTPAGVLELAILPEGSRPVEEDWAAPVIVDGAAGLILTNPARGTYLYWARVSGGNEKVVIEAFANITVT